MPLFPDIVLDHGVAELLSKLPRRGRGECARVDAEEVPPRRQEICAAARRRTARRRLDVRARERGDRMHDLLVRAPQIRHDVRADIGEHAHELRAHLCAAFPGG